MRKHQVCVGPGTLHAQRGLWLLPRFLSQLKELDLVPKETWVGGKALLIDPNKQCPENPKPETKVSTWNKIKSREKKTGPYWNLKGRILLTSRAKKTSIPLKINPHMPKVNQDAGAQSSPLPVEKGVPA